MNGTVTIFFVKTRLTPTHPTPLNNVESQESKMSRIFCTLYGLQHCVGGLGREISRCIFNKLIIGDFSFEQKKGSKKWCLIINWPRLYLVQWHIRRRYPMHLDVRFVNNLAFSFQCNIFGHLLRKIGCWRGKFYCPEHKPLFVAQRLL